MKVTKSHLERNHNLRTNSQVLILVKLQG
jgi:hypothetical protein